MKPGHTVLYIKMFNNSFKLNTFNRLQQLIFCHTLFCLVQNRGRIVISIWEKKSWFSIYPESCSSTSYTGLQTVLWLIFLPVRVNFVSSRAGATTTLPHLISAAISVAYEKHQTASETKLVKATFKFCTEICYKQVKQCWHITRSSNANYNHGVVAEIVEFQYITHFRVCTTFWERNSSTLKYFTQLFTAL